MSKFVCRLKLWRRHFTSYRFAKTYGLQAFLHRMQEKPCIHASALEIDDKESIKTLSGNIAQETLSEIKAQNNLLIRQEAMENSFILKGLPSFVGLATDERCNLKCIMCINKLKFRKTKALNDSIEEAYLIKFAEQVFPTAEILQLNTAGEPLMSRNFELELELAEKYNVKLDVITNGTLLNEKKGRLQKLARNAQAIQFSFDSPFKKTYESIRESADFDQVVENMRLFQKYRNEMGGEARPSFNINMVLMKRNLQEVPEMVWFAKEIGADRLGIGRVYVHVKEMEEESLEYCQEETNNALLAAKQLAQEINLSISTPPLFQSANENTSIKNEQDCQILNPPQTTKRCFFLWERVYIDAAANIFVCCEPSHPVAGNIKNNDFQDIWNGTIYQTMRRTFTGGPMHKLCDKCSNGGYLSGLT